jgi:rhamnosyltransferase
LSSLRNQTLQVTLEIIVLDSASTDNSCDIARSYGAKIIHISEGTFNHGLTRNTGVQHASGELIYLTVQDAWIGSSDMLEKMASHFKDTTVMGVMGHQAIPHEKDKNPCLWYRPYSEPGVTEKVVADIDKFNSLPTDQQQALVAWDDVVAMYRKSALMQQPFEKTDFAEDWIWSYQALQKGWKLLDDSSLVVYHYHHHAYRYAFNSTYTINYHFYKFFKYKPKLPALLMPMAQAMYHLFRNKSISLREKIYWILHNWSGRLARYFSTLNFLIRLKTGGKESMERGYNKYCKWIPQGTQKKT